MDERLTPFLFLEYRFCGIVIEMFRHLLNFLQLSFSKKGKSVINKTDKNTALIVKVLWSVVKFTHTRRVT